MNQATTSMDDGLDRILVVDDLIHNRQLLQIILENDGYEVCTAADGVEALKIVKQNPPHLVLLDIRMPELSGYEVCRQLKAESETAHIPIIFISALNNQDEIIKAFRYGGADYITKPFMPEEVLKRIQTQLNLMRENLKEKRYYQALEDMRHAFVHDATHDLKAPLSAVTGYAQLIEETTTDTHPDLNTIAIYARQLRHNAERMKKLIGNILDLARLETEQSFHFQPVSSVEFLEQCQRHIFMLTNHKSRQIQVETATADPLDTINIDIEKMLRAIENLIFNAIKYSPNGEIVRLYTSRSTDMLHFHISDEGLGIPSESLPYLFQPFYRVDAKSHDGIEGNGLGLAIVKSIVNRHHGRILVDSTPGKGTTFTISLPKTSNPVDKDDNDDYLHLTHEPGPNYRLQA